MILLDPQKLSGSLGHSYQEEVGPSSPTINSSPLSSNFLLTRTWMMIVPRRSEKYEQISVNSLGFAGMLLVKSEEELEFVKNVGVLHILEGVAIPKNTSQMN